MDIKSSLKKADEQDPASLQELAASLIRKGYGPQSAFYAIILTDTVSGEEETCLVPQEKVDGEALSDLRMFTREFFKKVDERMRGEIDRDGVDFILPFLRVSSRLFPNELPIEEPATEEEKYAREKCLLVAGQWEDKQKVDEVQAPFIILDSFNIPK